MGPHGLHDLALCLAHIGAIRQTGQGLRAQVGCQDDHRLLEIHGAPLTIGQNTVVQHLKQHVEHVRVGLFDLIEQDHLIGPAPHRFGQNAAFVISDIARRRTDQTGDRVFFHEFGHVDAHHGIVIIKQEFGHGLGQFGFTDTGWAKEQKTAQWTPFVVQPGAGAAHRIGHRRNGRILTDDTFVQPVFHAQQLVTFAFQHLGCRDPGPASDDLGDLFRAHGLFDHDAVGFLLFGLTQLFFQLRDHAIRKLARLGQIALTFGDFQIGAGTVQLFLKITRTGHLVTLGLPFGGHFV